MPIIVNEYWRMDRARLVEDRLLLTGQSEEPDLYPDPAMQAAVANARTFMDHTDSFMLLSLYEQRIHCALHRNRARLLKLQTERLVSSNPMAGNDLPAKSGENGFGHANSFSDRLEFTEM